MTTRPNLPVHRYVLLFSCGADAEADKVTETLHATSLPEAVASATNNLRDDGHDLVRFMGFCEGAPRGWEASYSKRAA